MYKNLIFDIGGIIIDDSNKNLFEVLNISKEKAQEISKICYGKLFHKYILGEIDFDGFIFEITAENKQYEREIKFVLSPENFSKVIPYYMDNIKQIYKLREKGFNVFFLSNITKETYEYIDKTSGLFKDFCGGVFSYIEHLAKPDKEIFQRIISKYNLNIDECLFFDDKLRNVDSANEIGLKSIQFNNFEDVLNAL